MAKYEKGILGMRKDPKNQMLFSFSVKHGEEWPSDSDDSDYEPPGVLSTDKPVPQTQVIDDKIAMMGEPACRAASALQDSSENMSDSDTEEYVYSPSSIGNLDEVNNASTMDSITQSDMSESSCTNGRIKLMHLDIMPMSLAAVASAEGGSYRHRSSNINIKKVDDKLPLLPGDHVAATTFQADRQLLKNVVVSIERTIFPNSASTSMDIQTVREKFSTKSIKRKSDVEIPKKRKRRRRKLKTNNSEEDPKKKKQQDSSSSCQSSHILQSSMKNRRVHCKTLPPELLLKIFKHVVDKHGSVPFLCRASRVCRAWNDVACNAYLWQNVDLSYGWIKSEERYLMWLSWNRLVKCTKLNLSGWKVLTQNGIKVLLDSCQYLRSITLSHCGKITAAAVRELADNCENLAEIDLTATSMEAVSQASLKYLLTRRGMNLTHLLLGDNDLKGFNAVLNVIYISCPKLELLDVSNVYLMADFLALNIEKFQEGCPRLRILRFVNSEIRAVPVTARAQVESPGFPCLEELSIALSTDKTSSRIAMDGDILYRLLKTSEKLKIIDVRGWSFHNFRRFIHLPSRDLYQLLIGQNLQPVSAEFNLEMVLQKWRHSLVELDLSWNSYKDNVLEESIQVLLDTTDHSPLEAIDLAGTNVEYKTICHLLASCPRLRAVNLSSCRSLPRGMKREYESCAITTLRRDIGKFEERGDG